MNSLGKNFVLVASALFFVLCLSGEACYCFMRPMSTLDTLAYVSLLDGGGRKAFQEAGKTCAVHVPGPHNGCDISDSRAFKTVAAYSPADYSTFVRFYRVMPLYMWSAYAIQHLFRVNSFVALRIISSLSYLLIALALALWLGEHLPAPFACLGALLIASLPPVLDLGKHLTPDALSAALVLMVIDTIYYRARNLVLQLAMLIILPLSRPDNLIFCALVGAVLIYRATPSFRPLITRLTGLAAGCILFDALLQKMTRALPYTILFIHSFINFWAPPSSYSKMYISFHDYLYALISYGSRSALINFPLPILFSVLALACVSYSRPLRDLVFVSMATAFLHLILFPNMEERFYTWYLVIAAAACTCLLGEVLSVKQSWSRVLSDRPVAKSASAGL